MSIKISELGNSATLQGDEEVPMVQNGATVKSSAKNIADLVNLSSKEDVANKSSNTALGTSDILYPTQNAVKTYVDSATTSLIRDRGNYDASTNLFPPTGTGSGTSGAIMKGDLWYISVAGTLGGTPVLPGYSIRALVNNPAQDAANWGILNVGLGYVPENIANKSNDGNLGTSTSLYPTQNAVKTYVDAHAVGLTSVGLGLGTAGTDLNVTSSPLMANGTITLNVPNASVTARGVVSISDQSFAGTKTFEKIKSKGLQLDITTTEYSNTGYTSLWSSTIANYNVLNVKTGSGSTSSLKMPNTGAYTYTFPTSTSTLATTTDLNSYVPYSGATSDVDLGTYDFLSNTIGINGADGSYVFSEINGDNLNYELNLKFKGTYDRLSISAYSDGLTNPNYIKVFNPYGRTKLLFPSNGTQDINIPDENGTLLLGGGVLNKTNYLTRYTNNSPAYSIEASSIYDDGINVFFDNNVSLIAGSGNSSADPSAILELYSEEKGFLPPRMTGLQAEAIANPATGLMVYAYGNGVTITSDGWWGYNGTTWVKLN